MNRSCSECLSLANDSSDGMPHRCSSLVTKRLCVKIGGQCCFGITAWQNRSSMGSMPSTAASILLVE